MKTPSSQRLFLLWFYREQMVVEPLCYFLKFRWANGFCLYKCILCNHCFKHNANQSFHFLFVLAVSIFSGEFKHFIYVVRLQKQTTEYTTYFDVSMRFSDMLQCLNFDCVHPKNACGRKKCKKYFVLEKRMHALIMEHK